MNFLNNAIAQVSELFRSMTPGARVTAGLLLAVVVVSFGYLVRQGTSGPDSFLFGGAPLSDGELNRIELAIASANLSGNVREGNRIRVPAGQQAAFLGAIADAGAQPANFNTILEEALGKTSPWESRDAARERIKDARQRQLSEIVRSMPWVEEAVVIFDEQETRGLSKQKLVTASVSVQPKLGEDVDALRADRLKKFLAGAVIGLQKDSIVVTDLGEGGLYAGGSAMDPAMFDNPYYKDKVMYEQLKRESILRILSPLIPGALVEVNAELDDTATETTITTTPDKTTQVALRSTETEESTKQATGAGGGRPGAVANSAIANGQGNAAESQPQNQSEMTKTVTETESEVGREQKHVTRQGFTPKEVQASVAIPTSHFEKVWRQQNIGAANAPTPEELKIIESEVIAQVQNIVEPLIKKTGDLGQDTFKRIRVVPLATLPVPQIEPPTISTKAIAWTSRYWNTLAMLGVAMFSLMVLRSVVKAAPPAAPNATPAAPALALSANEGSTPTSAEPAADAPDDDRPRLRLKKGTTVKDDLLQIVKEDPDAAADILRAWIGKAG
jgi:flagellar M-ring protein FliF